ncbi:MAG: PIN domain-containing protein [Planctomycetes bacterium]|nr:PIN domain-containing protein [Planctomycetota bacterium]MBI3846675.1 PIN domain-containing protein [Planctomycetota bacterium]
MNVGVVDAGVVLGWLHRGHRSFSRLEKLFGAGRGGQLDLVISVVNLAEVLIHSADLMRETGIDPVVILQSHGVRIHDPDEAVARRVARLHTSLADGFAAATAQRLNARLHTTDSELVRQLRGARLAITHY